MLELIVKLRQEIGKKNNQLRKQGLIPAILYGHGVKNIPLVVKAQDFEKIYQEAGESTLVKLKVKSKNEKDKERVVLIHDIQKNPVTDKIIHVDFYQVKMDEMLNAEVSLNFIGQSPAVIEQNGVLVKNIQQVEVEALPQNLPREIKVDISSLKTFDDNIYIKDLELPAGVKIIAEPEEVVASVVPPRKEAELEELEGAPEEKVEEVKVEAEEKREVKAEEIEEKAEKKQEESSK
jgi:large subunit ribosomal protein L25